MRAWNSETWAGCLEGKNSRHKSSRVIKDSDLVPNASSGMPHSHGPPTFLCFGLFCCEMQQYQRPTHGVAAGSARRCVSGTVLGSGTWPGPGNCYYSTLWSAAATETFPELNYQVIIAVLTRKLVTSFLVPPQFQFCLSKRSKSPQNLHFWCQTIQRRLSFERSRILLILLHSFF